MLSISDTLSLHRATRELYMKAARFARFDYLRIISGRRLQLPRKFLTLIAVNLTPGSVYIFSPRDAMHCFLRHARAANRKLVILKYAARRLARDIDNGYEPFGDELNDLLK